MISNVSLFNGFYIHIQNTSRHQSRLRCDQNLITLSITEFHTSKCVIQSNATWYAKQMQNISRTANSLINENIQTDNGATLCLTPPNKRPPTRPIAWSLEFKSNNTVSQLMPWIRCLLCLCDYDSLDGLYCVSIRVRDRDSSSIRPRAMRVIFNVIRIQYQRKGLLPDIYIQVCGKLQRSKVHNHVLDLKNVLILCNIFRFKCCRIPNSQIFALRRCFE